MGRVMRAKFYFSKHRKVVIEKVCKGLIMAQYPTIDITQIEDFKMERMNMKEIIVVKVSAMIRNMYGEREYYWTTIDQEYMMILLKLAGVKKRKKSPVIILSNHNG